MLIKFNTIDSNNYHFDLCLSNLLFKMIVIVINCVGDCREILWIMPYRHHVFSSTLLHLLGTGSLRSSLICIYLAQFGFG